ncbi:hypothetical protein M0R45_017875 [Rubus argutus]|uniref:Uncharacterized protein n=1 Tax=Rubus argutus TaxID=59490 RepID=A0AAW1XWS4_RUBAR
MIGNVAMKIFFLRLKITDGSNGDVANDESHLYKEDVGIMKNMNLDAYKFSISWSRLLPNGGKLSGGVNKEGIKYYNNLINELLRNDGALAPGRCSAWQQLNCTGGDSGTEPYLVAHHLLLAHAAAVKLYKQKYQASQKGVIGNKSVNASYLTDAHATQLTELNGVPIGLQAASSWLFVYPRGIRDLLLYTKTKYKDPRSFTLRRMA